MDLMSRRARWLTVFAVVVLFAAFAHVVRPKDGPAVVATWRLDGPLNRSATQLALSVMELSCASGLTADGRIEPAQVIYGDEQVVIAIHVRTRGADNGCPSNPETPFTVQLQEPVGRRALVDGGAVPPVTVVNSR